MSALLHADIARDLWQASADTLRMPEPMQPSTYSATYRVLAEGQAERAGPWDNDYFPYLPLIMDAVAEAVRTGKNFVLMKSAQGGGSEAMINVLFWFLRYFPGPILYLISTDKLAREFGRERFHYAIQTIRHMFDALLPGRSEMMIKRFLFGKVVLAGGQSVFNIQSQPYRAVFIDELDSLRETMGKEGDPVAIAKARLKSFEGETIMVCWAHPTTREGGAGKLYYSDSDQRRLHANCCHCGGEFWFRWEHVKAVPKEHGQLPEQAERDPSCYAYYCPLCACEISDAQRSIMLRNMSLKSILPPEEANKKAWIGAHFGTIHNPRKTVYSMAVEWIPCIDKESEKITFVQKTNGEPYEATVKKTTVEDWRRLIIVPRSENDPEVFRRGEVPRYTRFCTAGIDSRDDELHYAIWAWGLRRGIDKFTVLCGSPVEWGVLKRVSKDEHGRDVEFFETDYRYFDDIIFRRRLPRVGGGYIHITSCAIDTAWHRSQIAVYRYCLRWPGQAIPVRGGADNSRSSNPFTYKGRAKSYDLGEEKLTTDNLMMINSYTIRTDFFNMAMKSVEVRTEHGSQKHPLITLPAFDGMEDYEEFLEHLASEELQRTGRKDNKGEILFYKKKTNQNHWLDCSLYAYAEARNKDPYQGELSFDEEEILEKEEEKAALERQKARENVIRRPLIRQKY